MATHSPTLTKASRTSSACSLLRGVDTVSPRVIRVRLVRQLIKSGGFTYSKRPGVGAAPARLSPLTPLGFPDITEPQSRSLSTTHCRNCGPGLHTAP